MSRSNIKISLFWKIFVWFLFAVLIMVVLTGYLVLQSGNTPRYYDMPLTIKKSLFKMSKVLNKNGRLPRVNPHDPMRFFILDKDGNNINKRRHSNPRHVDMPKALKILHSHYMDTQEPQILFYKKYNVAGPKLINRNGETHYLYMSHDIRRMRWLAHQQLLQAMAWPQILILTLVATLLCFGLSWYIVRPIKKLRAHANQVANGDIIGECQNQVGHQSDEIGELASEIDHMLSKIENTIDTQKQLLSDVSHELRSPLARLQVALELARNKADGGLTSEFDRIALEADRLNQMISNLLQIATLDRGQLHEAKQKVDLKELLEALVEDANFEAQKKQVSIELNQPESQVSILGYYQLLASAIENIIRNAIRYSPEGGTITVTMTNKNNVIELHICDQGPGAPEAYLDKIFEPFFRPEQARTRLSGGAGLGLAIAKRSVTVHEGQISAYNQAEHGGLCVRIQL
jgi:two-component system, OmpR family, sensor histidine kinase CpxA